MGCGFANSSVLFHAAGIGAYVVVCPVLNLHLARKMGSLTFEA